MSLEAEHEIREQIRFVQMSGHGRSEIRYICTYCKKILNKWEEESGHIFCRRCLNQLFRTQSRNGPLIISVDGKSTLEGSIELQLRREIETSRKTEEYVLRRILLRGLRTHKTARKRYWRRISR